MSGKEPRELSDRLRNNKWYIDKVSHIEIDFNKCVKCEKKVCVYICPAACFELDDKGHLLFNYESCLECGTCRVVCPSGAIVWNYPKAGFGIFYRYG